MKRRLVAQRPGSRKSVAEPVQVVVVGGGIAGLAAATVLSERGVHVTLVEAESYLGGRAGSWTTRIADGSELEMERGFHAFFRHYYNLRSLLQRVDPGLDRLIRLRDYPICAPRGQIQSFEDLPTRPPWNFISLVRRAESFPLRDLLRVDGIAALEMLRYANERTTEKYDEVSAANYLDSLNFPASARRMLFDVFSHSFFNPENDMSAAELLMMFHYYFMGNPEGLVFDVLDDPFSSTAWGPLGDSVVHRGGEVLLDACATRIDRVGDGWSVAVTTTNGGESVIKADSVVLALSVQAIQDLVAASPDLSSTPFADQVRGLELTLAFAVWRLWLDRPTEAGRHPFVGTTGYGVTDNISLYHLFEDESRRWAERTGGAVVELHAYAVPDDMPEEAVRSQMLGALHDLYPETKAAGVVDERYLLRRDCPAFRPGTSASRPTVDSGLPGLFLAGDFVRLSFPSALMERAASSGMLAANAILRGHDVDPEAIYTVPPRGPLSVPRLS